MIELFVMVRVVVVSLVGVCGYSWVVVCVSVGVSGRGGWDMWIWVGNFMGLG